MTIHYESGNNSQLGHSVPVIIGIDIKYERLIIMFLENDSKFILASNDTTDTPEDILEHFDAFIKYFQEKHT